MDSPHFLSFNPVKYDYDGQYGEQRVRVKLPVGWNLDRLGKWAREDFNTHCHHPYDCCGHVYRTLYTHDAVRVKSRTYVVTIGYTRNI